MKHLSALACLIGLSACTVAGTDRLIPTAPMSTPETRLTARVDGGNWADAAPLAGLQATEGANCATTAKGTACLLPADDASPNRGLATADNGRCLARWRGTENVSGTLTLYRNAFPTTHSPRRETLLYMMNSSDAFGIAQRLTDPAAFTRLCDQLLQPDVLTRKARD